MKGKWARGIPPRFFAWVIKGKLAVSERPGGYARNHRKVRRHEEILWLRGEGFTRIVSLLPSPHNLHAYDELGVTWAHMPFGPHDDPHTALPSIWNQMRLWLVEGERILVHQEEVNDRLMGVVAGYLRWSGLVLSGPQSITVVEQLLHRQMGPVGRELAALAPELAGHAVQPLSLPETRPARPGLVRLNPRRAAPGSSSTNTSAPTPLRSVPGELQVVAAAVADDRIAPG